MIRSVHQLREDAQAIWRAGVRAVDSRQLIQDNVQLHGHHLVVGDDRFDLRQVGRIAVVGAGKAGAGMGQAVEDLFGQRWQDKLTGWINVPEDCVRPLQRIVLHGARPAGVNEPTAAGVEGTRRILELVRSLGAKDLCICLLSGGGSALLPLPLDEISLADKQAITVRLSAAGANIQELNTVRKQLSQIKGGGLARACRTTVLTLIISDVIGDPLDVIASGPTVQNSTTATDALAVLDKYLPDRQGISTEIWTALESKAAQPRAPQSADLTHVRNVVIGNNAVAVDAAGMEAERRGYSHAMVAARDLEGQAEAVGRHLADMAFRMRAEPGPDCLITGGEPVVKLAPLETRGKGGRNQQLVLAALTRLVERQAARKNPLEDIALLAGGTDGEDGPTDAAGAWIDAELVSAGKQLALDPARFLAHNDAYHFFEALGGLLKTGPTHTNVCDLRVVTVSQGR